MANTDHWHLAEVVAGGRGSVPWPEQHRDLSAATAAKREAEKDSGRVLTLRPCAGNCAALAAG